MDTNRNLIAKENIIIDKINGTIVLDFKDIDKAYIKEVIVRIPEGEISTISSIKTVNMKEGTVIKELTIPKDVIKIEDYAIDYVFSIEKLNILGDMTNLVRICNQADVRQVRINSAKCIGSSAFISMKLLEKITVSKQPLSIGNLAFKGCNSLLGVKELIKRVYFV